MPPSLTLTVMTDGAGFRGGRGARRSAWLAGLLGLFCAQAALAQATVELEVVSAEAYVDEPFVVQIRIRNFQQCAPPEFPAIPDCLIQQVPGSSESSQVVIVNGRMQQTRTRTYQYELTPRKTGELVIPPLELEVDGELRRTPARRVTVRPSDADELLSAEVSCDRARVYVGQRVRLRMAVWVKAARAYGRLLSAREMFGFIARDGFGPFPRPDRFRESTRQGTDGSREVYYVYETETDYAAERAGPLALDNVQISMQYPARFGRDVFGDVAVLARRRLRVRPKVASIEILPLPAAGRPASFNGAVGSYRVSVAAQPISVRVGDPIELTIDISGDGPLETLPAPVLTAQPQLTRAFRVPDESLAGEVTQARKRFKQIIRARRADVRAIPPIEYAYFDPEREQYVVARSAAIPITVTAAETLDVGDLPATSAAEPKAAGARQEPLVGLRGNETDERALLATTPPIGVAHVLLAALGPPAAFLLFWGGSLLARARHADPARRRRQAALRNARQRLNRARTLAPRELAREIEAALAGYLADRLDEPPARFTHRAALEFLEQRGVRPELRARWSDVLQRCELASYGGASDGDARRLAEEARECVALLEKERL